MTAGRKPAGDSQTGVSIISIWAKSATTLHIGAFVRSLNWYFGIIKDGCSRIMVRDWLRGSLESQNVVLFQCRLASERILAITERCELLVTNLPSIATELCACE
jgi:hypothetical protein